MRYGGKLNCLRGSALFFCACVVVFSGCSRSAGNRQLADDTGSPPAARKISSPQADAAEPAAAADNQGSLYVAYIEHAADKSADVYLQKFDPSLNSISEPVRIDPTAGEAKSWAGDPPTIKIGPDGAVFVGWTNRATGGLGTNLLVSVSRDGGRSFETSVRVNDDALPASHGMHSLAVDENGRVYVAWLDERNVRPAHAQVETDADVTEGNGFYIIEGHHTQHLSEQAKSQEHEPEPNSEVFFAVSNDGGRTFSANKRIASDVCPCCKTAVVTAPDGRLYVGWRQVVGDNFRHIAVASSIDQGATFTQPTIVSDDQWQIAACPVSGPALAAGDGDLLDVYWYSAGNAGQPGIYKSESKDSGKTFAPRQLVNFEATSGTPVLVNASSLVFCQSGGRIAVADTHSDIASSIADGSNPAGTIVGGKPVIAIVKNDGSKRAVWLTWAG